MAHALLSRFHGCGYITFPPELPGKLVLLTGKLRSDPENFTRIPRGSGREITACAMRPGDYVLVLAAEAMSMWLSVKMFEKKMHATTAAGNSTLHAGGARARHTGKAERQHELHCQECTGAREPGARG